MNGGIDCTCGHTIVEDGTCCCPQYCETCAPIDCCAESWAAFERAPDRYNQWRRVNGGTDELAVTL